MQPSTSTSLAPPQTGRAALLPVLALMLNALVWGLSWWPFRQLEGMGLHPLWSTAIVYGFAVLCIVVYAPSAWRALSEHPLLWLLFVASGLTNVGFNWAVTIGDVVRVVLLFYLMPAWSVLLAWPLLGERPTRAALARVALALLGVLIVLKKPDVPWPLPSSLADWLGIMGGASFALTNIMLRKMAHVPAPSRMMAMFAGGSTLAVLVGSVGALQGVVAAPAWPPVWAWLVLVLALFFLLSNVSLQYGAARLAAHTTALVMLSEVVFASVSAALLGAASWEWRTALGGALILSTAVWAAAH
jgi:drug/metabolite transporter (DMT)-like permease